ncbi:hypothetical protein D3C85_1316490 [compost metagenome]
MVFALVDPLDPVIRALDVFRTLRIELRLYWLVVHVNVEVLWHVGQQRNEFAITAHRGVVRLTVVHVHEQFTAQHDVLVTFTFTDALHDGVYIKRRGRWFFMHLVNRRLRHWCWFWSREDAELLKLTGEPIHGCS